MRGARHPALLTAACLFAVCLVAALAGGCASGTDSSGGTEPAKTAAPRGARAAACAGTPTGVAALRVSGVDCATGREVAAGWTAKSACAAPAGSSRTSCTVGVYRCLGTATGRGMAVDCARPGRSISFVVKRR